MAKFKDFRFSAAAVAVLAAIALLGAVLTERLCSPAIESYETDGARISLYKSGDYPISTNSYRQTGDRFDPDGDDPLIRFSEIDFDTESILILFSSPLEKNTPLQVFYWDDRGDFRKNSSTKATIPSGSRSFYIDTKHYPELRAVRFDFDEGFALDDIILCDRDMETIVTKEPVNLARLSVGFGILFVLLLSVWFLIRSAKKKNIRKRTDPKKCLKALIPGYILILVSGFMLLIFEPITMYAMSMDDFWFDFRIMIGPLTGGFALFILIGIVAVTAVYLINIIYANEPKLYRAVLLCGFILFFLLYVQGNYLNGSLPVLEGAEIDWGDIGKTETVVFAVLLAVLIGAAVVCVKKIGGEKTARYAAGGVCAVFLMLSVSLVTTVFEKDALKSKDTFVSSWDNFNVVSSQRNFLIFLADSVDSFPFYEAMNQNEEFNGLFDDFTYYSDAMSTYPYTYFSIPQILSGAVYHYESDYDEFCANAYNSSPLFEKLDGEQYELNIYSDITWPGEKEYAVENAASVYDVGVDITSFMKQELKYVLFRYLPYPLKPLSRIGSMDFNACRSLSDQSNVWEYSNISCYQRITESTKLRFTDENYFQFYHVSGGHLPFRLDKDLNYVSDGTYTQQLEATLTIIKAYLDRLKENNAYDNSIIVVMSDHGYQTTEEGQYKLQRFNPILFIKGVNESHEMIRSEIPVSFTDLQDAFSALLDGKQSTELFSEVRVPRVRTALIYSSEGWMHEYQTEGTARDWDRYFPTGNEYLEKK